MSEVPQVDLEVVAEWIRERTGIPAETVLLVLMAETEWMIENGLIGEGDSDE